MNNKGFTMVELLATIAILSIIMGIATVGVTTIFNNSRKKAYEDNEQILKRAAQSYSLEHSSEILTGKTGSATINYNTLLTGGYLERLEDPVNKGACSSSYVVITKNAAGFNSDFTYKICLKCSKYTSKDC